MSGHTPGPWHSYDGGIYGNQTRPVHGGKTCAECAHDPADCGDSIVTILTGGLLTDIRAGDWDGLWDESDEPKPEDLRLIAAAPELLAALIELVETAERAMNLANNDGGMFEPDEQLAEARAAITKATTP